MTGLVRSELRKITSTRLWWGLLIGAVVYTVIQAAANAALAGTTRAPGSRRRRGCDTGRGDPDDLRGLGVPGQLHLRDDPRDHRHDGGVPLPDDHPDLPRDAAAGPGRARQDGRAPPGGHRLRRRGAWSPRWSSAARSSSPGATPSASTPTGCGPRSCSRSSPSACGRCSGIGIGTLIRNQVAAVLVAVFVTFLVEPLATFILAANDLDGDREVAAHQRLHRR